QEREQLVLGLRQVPPALRRPVAGRPDRRRLTLRGKQVHRHAEAAERACDRHVSGAAPMDGEDRDAGVQSALGGVSSGPRGTSSLRYLYSKFGTKRPGATSSIGVRRAWIGPVRKHVATVETSPVTWEYVAFSHSSTGTTAVRSSAPPLSDSIPRATATASLD